MFTVSNRTISRLREFAGENVPISTLLQTVPVIQLEGRKVIFNQPLSMVSQSTTISPREGTMSSLVRVMGVDLGLKHFAVLSIFEYNKDTGKKQEVGRHFLDQRRVLACKFDPVTLRFNDPFRLDYNIIRRLEHLRKQQRSLGSIKNRMEDDGGKTRTKKYYHIKKSHNFVWKKIRKIHSTLTGQIAHTIMEIALAYNVSLISFEDLRWSTHSSRKSVGKWLSHNQQHFFHGQVIDHVQTMAVFKPLNVKRVCARWSSQIAWTVQSTKSLKISMTTGRHEVESSLGKRTRKTFFYESDIPDISWKGDSDLNAARNMALRGLTYVKRFFHMPPLLTL